MIATLWTPLTSDIPFLWLGLLLYAFGMVLFVSSVITIIKTPPNELFAAGPYRFTRNPMYVSATAIFVSICVATANLALAGYLVIAVLLQHFMILAEERICRKKYGIEFERYVESVPRYLLV